MPNDMSAPTPGPPSQPQRPPADSRRRLLPLRSGITALARERQLGSLRSVHRRRRGQPPQRLWPLWIVMIFFDIAIFAIGIAAGQHLVATLLIVAVPVGVAVFRYAVKPHVVALYEHGMVDAQGKQVRAARWEDIPYVW